VRTKEEKRGIGGLGDTYVIRLKEDIFKKMWVRKKVAVERLEGKQEKRPRLLGRF